MTAAALAVPRAGATEKSPACQHIVACGLGRHPRASHRCRHRATEGAYFRARRGSVYYTVCVRFPAGRSLCVKHQVAERGVLYVNAVRTSSPGLHRITWFVKGKRVGRFYFRVAR